MKRAENQIVVITGGNSGIGKGVAKKFADEGAKVVIFGRDAKKLEAVKREIGHNILAIQGDVTSGKDLQTKSHFGMIDTLIANAGIAQRKHVEDVDEKFFNEMVNINYRGLFFTVKYALDFLKSPSSV